MKRSLFLFLVVLSLPLSVLAADDGDEDARLAHEKPDQGWFWYEHPKEESQAKKPVEQPVEKTEKKEKVEPDKSEKHPISAAWLRENLPKLHERAIDNPTRENIQAYFYAQRAMMDKAQRYSEAAINVVHTDPLLDENNRIPISQYGKNAVLDKEFLGKRAALKHLAGSVGGLFMFFDSRCDFCRTQARTVNAVAKDYGFSVKYISMDGKGLPEIPVFEKDNGHAKDAGSQGLSDDRICRTSVHVSHCVAGDDVAAGTFRSHPDGGQRQEANPGRYGA